MRHALTYVTLTALLLPACRTSPADNARAVDLADLTAWMTGTFSSAAQHKAHPDDYFDIRLVMFPIWPERADGPWLYVEQAVAASAARPYRQRVYQLVTLPDGTLRSDVYTLPGDAQRYAGAWRTPELFAALTPQDLTERRGCSITLHRTNAETFLGSTHERDCSSERDGAAYATSEVVVTRFGLMSWDRGFDARGEQVWGAAKGAYCFDKVSEGAPE